MSCNHHAHSLVVVSVVDGPCSHHAHSLVVVCALDGPCNHHAHSLVVVCVVGGPWTHHAHSLVVVCAAGGPVDVLGYSGQYAVSAFQVCCHPRRVWYQLDDSAVAGLAETSLLRAGRRAVHL